MEIKFEFGVNTLAHKYSLKWFSVLPKFDLYYEPNSPCLYGYGHDGEENKEVMLIFGFLIFEMTVTFQWDFRKYTRNYEDS